MSEQSDFSCTDLPPPKDIIYSVPPIHLYPLNYDNDSRGKGRVEVNVSLRKGESLKSSHPSLQILQYFHQPVECPGVLAPGGSRRGGGGAPGRVPAFAAPPDSLFRECLGVMCDDADHHTYESFMEAWVSPQVVGAYVTAPIIY